MKYLGECLQKYIEVYLLDRLRYTRKCSNELSKRSTRYMIPSMVDQHCDGMSPENSLG